MAGLGRPLTPGKGVSWEETGCGLVRGEPFHNGAQPNPPCVLPIFSIMLPRLPHRVLWPRGCSTHTGSAPRVLSTNG